MSEKNTLKYPTPFELSQLAIQMAALYKEAKSPELCLNKALQLYSSAHSLLEVAGKDPGDFSEEEIEEMAREVDEGKRRTPDNELEYKDEWLSIEEAKIKIGYEKLQSFYKLINDYEKKKGAGGLRNYLQSLGVDKHWIRELKEFRIQRTKLGRQKGGDAKAEKKRKMADGKK